MKSEGWLKQNTFHHSRFCHLERLEALKKEQKTKISLVFPTHNEEATIGKEIIIMQAEFMERYSLIDEIVVIDSDSTDHTREIAKRFGAIVFESKKCLPQYQYYHGKGENLWKSLYLVNGDIIVWIDADIKNITPKFIYGLIGPLLEFPQLGYVKGFYHRPLAEGQKFLKTGGGRVSEILIRPLFDLFYPELNAFFQPLSGEYAGRRKILEDVPFFTGYGVETGLLIDIYLKFGLSTMAQVDLDYRIHRNQSLENLSRMASTILQIFINRLQDSKKIQLLQDITKNIHRLVKNNQELTLQIFPIETQERPPMASLKEYQQKIKTIASVH